MSCNSHTFCDTVPRPATWRLSLSEMISISMTMNSVIWLRPQTALKGDLQKMGPGTSATGRKQRPCDQWPCDITVSNIDMNNFIVKSDFKTKFCLTKVKFVFHLQNCNITLKMKSVYTNDNPKSEIKSDILCRFVTKTWCYIQKILYWNAVYSYS